jgi:hypothetical protein
MVQTAPFQRSATGALEEAGLHAGDQVVVEALEEGALRGSAAASTSTKDRRLRAYRPRVRLPDLGGIKESAIHWDLVKDLRRGGRIELDGRVVQESGTWIASAKPAK